MKGNMIRVAIIGATGYTGLESIEILLRHGSESHLPDRTARGVRPRRRHLRRLRGRLDMNVEPLDMGKLAESADVALCCLPHKVSMTFVPRLLETGLKVIDFSADYRLKDVVVYEKYYQPHTDRENLAHAVFGLPELFREDIRGARLVANPGCYPTGALLAIAPLLKNGLIETKGIIVNSVTGVTGGGKNLRTSFITPT